MASYGRGITNAQAKYLAALARELRVPYPGNGMTRAEASSAIDAMRAELDARRPPGAARRRGDPATSTSVQPTRM